MFLCTVYAHNVHLSTSVPVVPKGEFLKFSENSTQLFSSGALVNKVYLCAFIVYINVCAIIHILPKKKECIYKGRKKYFSKSHILVTNLTHIIMYLWYNSTIEH